VIKTRIGLQMLYRICVACMVCSEKTCPDEVDAAGIHWPLMLPGYIALHRCPSGMAGW